MLGDHLNSEITTHTKKAQMSEKHGTKWTVKRTLVFTMKIKTEKSRASPCWTSAGNVHTHWATQISTALCMPVNDYERETSISWGL